MLLRKLKNIICKNCTKNEKDPYLKYVPLSPRQNDIYLVEFPKSGITWLSFMMAYINIRKSGTDKNITFYNLIDIIPSIHISRNIGNSNLQFPGCRFIKSHSEYNPHYKKIIYLVRDPRSVMISYFYFLKNLGEFNGTLSEFIKDTRFGAIKWHTHVRGWIKDSDLLKQRIIFIKYEDLKTKTEECLKNIYIYLGYDLSMDLVKQAVKESSIQKMKEQEDIICRYDVRRQYDNRYTGFNFVRQGEINNFSELLENDIEYINYNCKEMMQLFGYT